MSTGANALQPFIERRERNLAWFRKHYPQIAKHFETYKMNRWRVNILPERDEVDLLAPEGNLYGGSGRDYAHKEVQVFRDAYREGSQVRSINPPFSGEFYHPRFIHARINALISRSPLQRGNFAGYRVPDFYPMVVFLGIGLGYHIEEMVLQHDVLSALVVEPDLDKFAGSLYAVDWAGIGERIRARKGQTLHFILGSEEQEDLLWAATWNRVTECCPVFPVCTLFYNHQGRKLFDNVSERINSDMYVYLGSWGHYDDEVRQLNNALHNFYRGLKKLPPKASKPCNVPIFIFGSGPSVDDRIDTVRRLRDKAIVVSCGTALR
ncbi:MAG: hypothetical protein LPK85_04770, partial [Gammaproteobacteria bacterium]|nr:hypothetical protein [Gammaproteobacteria bacterium]